MIFGIIALAKKSKLFAILAIVFGSLFSIFWLWIGIESGPLTGAVIIIFFTTLPDLIMGSLSLLFQGNPTSSNQMTYTKSSSLLKEKLAEIEALKDEGTISEEEYIELRKKTLKL